MKRGLKLIVSWLCIVAVFTGLIPGGLLVNSASAAASGEIVWPNPGATNLKKIAEPVAGKQGQWKITLTVEGKNIKTASDVVLVIDRSGSMKDSSRMDNARTAAQKFVDNLLLKDSATKIGVVTFDKTADIKSELLGVDKKADLTKVIKNITVSSEGTNIQAGLNKASTMLDKSTAQNKVIVLLSDGAPTYSYKASNASEYSWPNNKYKFTLSDFNYNKVLGSGGDFSLEYWSGLTYKNETYTVNNKFKVQDNGIAALSEAKLARDSGIGVYSIGLEVGSDDNAKYVLNNVQNKGYYSSNSGDLSKVFNELSGQISYAAQNAEVTDPMGAMFNKVGEPTISQGTIEWNSTKETFTWKVGNVMEGSPATLTYIVELDPKQTIDSNTAYPTNGDTILRYDDINGKKTTKYFEVPKVSFGKGSILVKGYRVNNDGQPINEDGVVVDKPEQAQELVKGYYFKDKSNNEALDINKSYDVSAPSVDGYELKVGTDPSKVSLTIGNPTPTVWFGYVQAVEQQVSVKYLEKETNKELLAPTTEKGLKGKQVQLTAKTIPGYSAEKASDKYTFTADKNQTYTFYYTANEQTVTVKYLEKGSNKPVSPEVIVKGATGKEVSLEAASVKGYTPESTVAKYIFTAESGQIYTFYYTANDYTVKIKYQDESGKDIAPSLEKKGKAGDNLEMTPVEVEGYTPVKSSDVYTFTNEDNQVYVFKYQVKTYPVTVKFVDESGKELADSLELKGKAGETLTVTAASVDGYTPSKSSDTYTVTKADTQVYVFKYTANDYNVTVKFEDEGGKELSKPVVLKGKAGEQLEVTAAKVDGYTPSKLSDTYTVTKADTQVYVFKYTANIYTVTVKFQDESGKELSKPVALKGKAGEKLDVTAAEVEDYTPIISSDQYTVTTEEVQQYVFKYKVKTYTVLVKFIDENENELATAIKLEGAAGDKLDVTAANVDGYTPNKVKDVYTVNKNPNQTYVFTYTLTTYPVTVKYQDEHGAKLADPLKLEGTEGQTLELTAADVKGYTPKNSTHQYTVIKAANQEYVFTYTLKTFEVQVNFVDEDGTALIPASKAEGKPGDKLTLKAETIEGYTPDQASFEYEVTKEDNQSHTFHYKANNQTATVKYLAQDGGKVLADETTVSGKPGTTVDVAIPAVAGYTPVNEKESYTFTKDAGQEHVVYYTANAQTVTVNYVEEGTNDTVAPSTTQSGVTDATITLKAAEVPGYTPVKEEESYTFNADEKQSHTFYYKANNQTATVKYLAQDGGKVLADETTVSGKPGTTVDVAIATVAGYTPVNEKESYTFTKEAGQVHVVYYTANAQTVTVNYVEEGTNDTVAPSTTQSGVTDATITLKAAEVPGYTPVKAEDSYTFKANEEHSYTFTYKKQDYTVKVRFVDEDGNDLIPAHNLSGKAGDELTVTAKEVAGYRPVKETDQYVVTTKDDQVYEFHYNKLYTVLVQFVDEENKELATAINLEGIAGQELTVTAAEVSGYTPHKQTDVYVVNKNAIQSYTFYYTANEQPQQKRTVTVKYLTSDEVVLQNPTTQEGVVGETITLEAPHFDGYTTKAYSVQYTVSEQETQEYVFLYTKVENPDAEQRTVTIHYVDQGTGNALAEDTIIQGNVGDTLLLTADKITIDESVYTPINFQHDYIVTGDAEQSYTFYYLEGDVENIQQVLVKYVDQESGQTFKEHVRKGRVEESITIAPGSIKVGDVVYTPVNPVTEYMFTSEENQEIEIYFVKEGAPVEITKSVAVKYVDQDSNTEVAPSTVETGKVGSSITLTAVSVAGYTPVKSSEVYKVEDQDGQEYIFYYKKNTPPVTPVDPNPSTPSTPSNPSGSSSVTPLPPAPPVVTPLPPAPPKLETDNHYNYINGYPDGMIKPENNISREEVAAIFYRLMDDATRSDYLKNVSTYKDVAGTRWSSKNIATMENAGIITGYPDGTFKPERQITRAEFAAIASRFDNLDEQENSMFSDIKGHWAEKYIVSAANKGWIKGYLDGKFKPDQYITRAEAMAFINSVLNRKVKADGIHEDAKKWPDNTPNKWYYTDVLEATNNHDYSRNTDNSETWEQVKPDRVYP